MKLFLPYWPSSAIFEMVATIAQSEMEFAIEYEIENQREQRYFNKLIRIPRVIAWLIASATKTEISQWLDNYQASLERKAVMCFLYNDTL